MEPYSSLGIHNLTPGITTTSTLLARPIFGHTVKHSLTIQLGDFLMAAWFRILLLSMQSYHSFLLIYNPVVLTNLYLVQTLHQEELVALNETRAGLVIDLKTQLSYFKNVSGLLRQKLGDEEAESLLSRAVYLFSVGGNDYLFPFETNSRVLYTFSVEQFIGQVMGNITQVVEEIYKVGGRKFGFPSLWPLECLPFTRRLELEGGKKAACFEPIKPYKEEHNKQLPKLLQKLQSDLKGFKYSFPDFHTLLEQLINHPSKYGFKEGKVACCGSGPYKGILSCGGRRGVVEYHLCDNVTEYLFFDSAHPTERANRLLAQLAWSGERNVTGPYNLKALFEV